MKEIVLKDGRKALVDDNIYEKYNGFKNYKFFVSPQGHVTITSSLHRLVMIESGEEEPTKLVDHIDRNPLNNCRENLRWSTRQQNSTNSKKRKNGRSKYKGVSYTIHNWRASININGKNIYIGYFSSEEDAAIAYDIFAKKYFGEYAYINFPNISSEETRRILEIIQNPKKNQGGSIYYGVAFKKRLKKWRAIIIHKSKTYHLGYFDSEIEAALAYNKKAIEFHGDKAKLNNMNKKI